MYFRRSIEREIALAMTLLLGIGLCGGCAKNSEARFSGVSDGLRVTEHASVDPDDATEWSAVLERSERNDVWHTQERDEFCWAACTQTILSLEGRSQIPTQTELWEKVVYNPLFNRDREAATYQELRYALAPEFRDVLPGYEVLDLGDFSDITDLIREVAAGRPVIIGLRDREASDDMGHAYVAYGIRFREATDRGLSIRQGVDAVGNTLTHLRNAVEGQKATGEKPRVPTNTHEILGFFLFDPYPGDGGPEYMEIEEVVRTLDFAISKTTAKAFLEEQHQWLRKYDKGPGIYVRRPHDPTGSPLARYTLELDND